MAALVRQGARLLRHSFQFNSLRACSTGKKQESLAQIYSEADNEVQTSTEGFYSELTGQKLEGARDLSGEELLKELGYIGGQQRVEMLDAIKGVKDPYDMALHKQAQFNDGTLEYPIIVPTTAGERLVGCVCEQDISEVNWMVLHAGTKKQCFCGNWFQAVKIPGTPGH